MNTLRFIFTVSTLALVPLFAAAPNTPSAGTNIVIGPDVDPSAPTLATDMTGRPGPAVRVIDSSTSAQTGRADELDLSGKVESAARDAGLTLESSGMQKLKELESKADNILSQKSLDDTTKKARAAKGIQTLSDAIVAEAKANPRKPVTAEFIQSVLIKLCPLFPFCS